MANKIRGCTFKCPINIALVKYWGKKNEEFNSPLNPSLSVTLDTNNIYTITKVDLLSTSETESVFILNSKIIEIKKGSRVDKILNIAKNLGLKTSVRIETFNNFPDTAGLASSSSGFCALAKCLGILLDLSEIQVQNLARIGSGSSIRSYFGGFVEWKCGTPDIYYDSLSSQIFKETHWPELEIFIVQLSSDSKSVPSSLAMKRSTESSDLLRLKTVDKLAKKRIDVLKEAILKRNFSLFAEIIMKESQTFHAICLDTFPPIEPPYLSDKSHKIIKFVNEINLNYGKTICGYTFDAGPNPFIFVEQENSKLFLNLFLTYFIPFDPHDKSLKEIIFQYQLDLPFREATFSNISADYKVNFEKIYSMHVGDGPKCILKEYFSDL